MKRSGFFLSSAAADDIVEQADWYRQRSGVKLAARWEQSIQAAILRIVANPRCGAPCHFKNETLHAVRRLSVPRFRRHLIFYRLKDGEILVLRVIHGARDLENLL